MTASCPSAADRLLKGKGEGAELGSPGGAREGSGISQARAPGPLLGTRQPSGAAAGLGLTSHTPQPVWAESRSGGSGSGREEVRTKHKRRPLRERWCLSP